MRSKKILDRCSYYVQRGAMRAAIDQNARTGQNLARGVCRMLASHGFVTVEEFVPHRGLRADVMALGPKSELWIVECKSSLADFRSDTKWTGYLEWCDQYFWAVGPHFPLDMLPDDTGIIVADEYGGEILRTGPLTSLATSRRKKMLHRFAQTAARRLQQLRDPTRVETGD